MKRQNRMNSTVNREPARGPCCGWGPFQINQTIGTTLGTKNRAHLNFSPTDRTCLRSYSFLINSSQLRLGVRSAGSTKVGRSSMWIYFAARRTRAFASKYRSPKIRNGRGKKATTSKDL